MAWTVRACCVLNGLADVPVLVWVVAVAALLAGGRYAQLWWQCRAHRPAEASITRSLGKLYDGLAKYARFHDDGFPDSFEGEEWALAHAFTVRGLPRWGVDDRLVLAYDREARHRLIDFPCVRRGRAVLLATGKVVVVSEEQFEQLLRADDRLRDSLGLESLGV
ncbi:MAG: hypothetical protein GY842_05330 [bacterium]|nr:hypothetical protein [bacterium]